MTLNVGWDPICMCYLAKQLIWVLVGVFGNYSCTRKTAISITIVYTYKTNNIP